MAFNFKHFAIIGLATTILVACADAVPRQLLPDSDGIVRSFLAPATRLPVSQSASDVLDIASAATSRSRAELDERRSTQTIRLDQLAYFFRAPEGRAYLLAPEPKALVRATPEASCPVQVSAQGGTGASEQSVIADALRFCHEDLAAIGAEDCGCALLAHGPVLRAPLAAFEYAIDLPTRLFEDGRLDPVRYLAHETLEEDGARHLRVQANGETVVEIIWPESGAAFDVRARFADGVDARGFRTPVGFDRGRLVQSFTLERTDGKRVRVILAP